MKIAALILSALGILSLLLGALSIFGAMPAMVSAIEPFGPDATTAVVWWVLAALIFLASISFGTLAKKEL